MLVIWGASSQAMVIADAARLAGYEVAGFLDDVDPGRAGDSFAGAPILGGAEQLPRLLELGVTDVVVGVGDGRARMAIAELVKATGLRLATVIHPSAIVASGVEIGEGTVAFSGVVLEPGVRVGANVVLNSVSGVGHESVVEDGAHLSGRVSIAGLVTIGRGALLEMGTVVAARSVRIGAGAVVGAGSLVLKDIPDHVVAYGSPAKVVRRLEG